MGQDDGWGAARVTVEVRQWAPCQVAMASLGITYSHRGYFLSRPLSTDGNEAADSQAKQDARERRIG